MAFLDVFVCVGPQTILREGFAIATIERWRMEPDTRVCLLYPSDDAELEAFVKAWNMHSMSVGTLMEFQRRRRIAADTLATGAYVLSDDDMLLPKAASAMNAAAILERHQDYGAIAWKSINADIREWTPEGYTTRNTDDVLEHVSIGGAYICRKGVLDQWPQLVGRSYDREHGEALRAVPMRVGYFRNLGILHLGEGYSTVWA